MLSSVAALTLLLAVPPAARRPVAPGPGDMLYRAAGGTAELHVDNAAGSFSLRPGKQLRVTRDGEPVSRSRVLQVDEMVTVLDDDGNVLLSAWYPRQRTRWGRQVAHGPGLDPLAACSRVGFAVEPGAGPGEGLRVEHVADRSVAGRLGLRAGDVVLAVDGGTAPGTVAWHRMVLGRPAGDVLRLEVGRGNQPSRVVDVPLADAAPTLGVRELQAVYRSAFQPR